MATIKGIKVGTSTITASYGGKSSTVTLTVSALNLSGATISGLSNIVYDGAAHKTNPTVTMSVGGTSTTLTKDTDYTVSWSNSSDSSTCVAAGTITVTVTGKGNFTGTKTASYQITNASITVKTSGKSSVTNQSYTYSGSAQGVGLVATTVNSQTATIRYGTTSDTYNLTSAPQATNVADSKTVYYQVTAPNHTSVTGSYTLTITEKSISISAPTNGGGIYKGSGYTATFSTVTGATISKYRYSTTDGSGWTETTTNPSQTNVGTLYVQAYYSANTNYTGSDWSSSTTITVTGATITVTAPNQSYVYSGSAQGAAISATTVNSQTATIKYGTTSGAYNLDTAPQITNVAESKTIYYQVTAPNHTTNTGSYTLTITAKAITIPVPTSASGSYTGSGYSASFGSATGATISKYRHSTDNATWTEVSTNPSISAAGTYYVQAYYNANTNYSGSNWSSSATITISNATITVTASNQTYTYDGSAHGAAISATTTNSQTATIMYGTTSGTYNLDTAPKITNVADSKTIYYQVTAPNHTTKTGSYTLTITKATPTMSLLGNIVTPATDEVSPSGIEYHGTAYVEGKASVLGTIYWGTSSSSMTNTATVSSVSTTLYNTSITTRTALGTTTVYAYFVPTDSSNYNSLGDSSTYHTSAEAKVIPATDNDISVNVSGTLYYTGGNQVIATKVDDHGVEHFTLGYSTESNGTVTWGTQDANNLTASNPGTYYIHYKLTPDSNHSVTITDQQLPDTVTIGNGTLTVTATAYTGTYDTNPHNVITTISAKNQANSTVNGVTYTYCTTENGTYTGTLPQHTNATTGTIYYWKAEKTGYDTATGYVTVVIDKADNPFSITSPTTTSDNRHELYNTSGYNTVQISVTGAQGGVSYSSSNTSLATVSNTGLVTYVAAGTPNITVTAAGNDNYNSGSKTVYISNVEDTVVTYGDVTGVITITQKEAFPASGVTLTTSNISTYFEYTSTCTQAKTWASGNTTTGTITYDWSGTNVSIPSLGSSETAGVTSRVIDFTLTASGEGSKSMTETITSGNQEANPATAVALALKDSGTVVSSVVFGSMVSTELTATYKSNATGTVTPTSVSSNDTTVATIETSNNVKGVKVGTATITAFYGSLSDSQSLDVITANLTNVGSISAISATTYTGSAQTPLPTVTATIGGESVNLVNNIDYDLSYSDNTAVGQATVTVTGKGNYTGSKSATWTINGAEIVVDYTNQTYQYNKTAQGVGVSATTVNSQEATIRYGLTSGTYDLSEVPQFTDVSNNTVYYRITADNHEIKTGSYTVEITPLVAQLMWGTLNFTYDGTAHTTTCTVNNLISGDSCDVYLSGNSITEIGTTTVEATGLSNANYTLPNETTAIMTVAAGLFIKLAGVWTSVKKVFKKISGNWVEQNAGSSFSTTERYKKVN